MLESRNMCVNVFYENLVIMNVNFFLEQWEECTGATFEQKTGKCTLTHGNRNYTSCTFETSNSSEAIFEKDVSCGRVL